MCGWGKRISSLSKRKGKGRKKRKKEKKRRKKERKRGKRKEIGRRKEKDGFWLTSLSKKRCKDGVKMYLLKVENLKFSCFPHKASDMARELLWGWGKE